MTVCFQLDPKDCPDIRHAGQRIIEMNSVPEKLDCRIREREFRRLNPTAAESRKASAGSSAKLRFRRSS